MKKRVYLFLEIKRILKTALQMFAGAIVLAVIVGAIAFYAQKMLYGDQLMDTIRIGIVVDSDETDSLAAEDLMRKALGFLESMDSVKSTCEFIYTDSDNAMEGLEDGSFNAVMLIPQSLVSDIIDGTNTPVKVLFSENDSLAGAMLEELTKAGARTLGSAQAGIYTVHDLFLEHGLEAWLQDAYDALNGQYLKFALARGRAFSYETVSVTGSLTSVEFYAVNGLLFFILLTGMGLAKSLRKENEQVVQKLHIAGISRFQGALIRFVALWIVYSVLCTFLLGVMLWWLVLPIYYCFAGVIIGACAASLFLLLYTMADSSGSGILLVFMVASVCMLLSGGIIPAGFMPEALGKLGQYLPTGRMMIFLHGLFSGNIKWGHVVFLVIYIIIFLGMTCLLLYKKGCINNYSIKNQPSSKQAPSEPKLSDARRPASRISWLWFTCSFKMLFGSKAFVVILILFPVLCAIGGKYMRSEESAVKVGIYIEAAKDPFARSVAEQLVDENGILSFYLCSSKEALKNDVASMKAECGYVFPENIKEKMDDGENKNLLTTIVSPGTVVSRLVDEVVFSYIFQMYSENILTNYLADSILDEINALDAGHILAAVEKHRSDGSTFEFEYVGTTGNTYVKAGIFDDVTDIFLAVFMLICALLGTYEGIKAKDRKVYIRLGYQAAMIYPAFMTVAAVLCGSAVSFLCLIYLNGFYHITEQLLWLAGYLIFTIGYCRLVASLFSKENTFGMVIPVLTLGSLMTIITKTGLGESLPAAGWLMRLFPPVWFVDNRLSLWTMFAVGLVLCGLSYLMDRKRH